MMCKKNENIWGKCKELKDILKTNRIYRKRKFFSKTCKWSRNDGLDDFPHHSKEVLVVDSCWVGVITSENLVT